METDRSREPQTVRSRSFADMGSRSEHTTGAMVASAWKPWLKAFLAAASLALLALPAQAQNFCAGSSNGCAEDRKRGVPSRRRELGAHWTLSQKTRRPRKGPQTSGLNRLDRGKPSSTSKT